MAQVVNKTIVGTPRNDILTNKNSRGFTYMEGLQGNDTYNINNFASTFTMIEDEYGYSRLNIPKTRGTDVLFVFDVSVDPFMDDTPFFDGLIVAKRSLANSVATQIRNFLQSGERIIPQTGGLEFYFGSVNGNWQKTVKNIYATDTNGARYSFNLLSYAKILTPTIRRYIQSIGYNNAAEVLNTGSSTQVNKLLNIYKNGPMSYTVIGSAKNDTFSFGNGSDVIYGRNGNDIISAGAGNDKIFGELGNDIIKAGAGKDTITGGRGNDKIYFMQGSNTAIFNVGDGKDIMYKGTGSDTLMFNNFANASKLKAGLKAMKSGYNLVLRYTSRDDVTLYNYYKSGTKSSVTTLKAKNGSTIAFADYLSTTIFNTHRGIANRVNKINGSSLNDLIYGNNKNDILKGGAGNDKIYGGAGNDTIDGGAGNDIIYGQSGTNTLTGGAGNDKIYGGTGSDKIYAGAGNDKVEGGAGNDIIYGQYGVNTLKGGVGNDIIYSCASSAYDASGASYMYGNAGADKLFAQTKTSYMYGGADNDSYYSYMDINTTISDNEGTNTLNLLFNKTTSKSAAKDSLHVVFNVDQAGNLDANGIRIVDDEGYAAWQTNINDNSIKGVKITNGIDTFSSIKTSDGYQLTSAKINTLKAAVAGWLSDGRDYVDVGVAIASADKEDLLTFIAANTDWA